MSEIAGELSDPLGALPASAILRELASTMQPSVPVRTLVAALGLRAHGILLVLFALPDVIPLPVPSASAILGIPLVIIAAHLTIFGEGAGLPERILKGSIPAPALRVAARFGIPILRALEFFTRPRWLVVPAMDRTIGLICLYLSVLLLLPIPFINFPPAFCLVVVAMGMVQKDGLVVTLGVALTVVLTGLLIFLAEWLVALFS